MRNVRWRTRIARPRVAIGILVFLCAVVAIVSVAQTSGSDGTNTKQAADVPFDPSKLSRIHPKDAIPSLDDPRLEQADSVHWLNDREPVVAVGVGASNRAYPLRVLTWHEIVNDELAGRSISVTYCPHCGSVVVFVRPRIEGSTASFDASGLLYRSNLVMSDRVTGSLWPQLTGLAVRGDMAGSRLLRLPVSVVAWRDFLAAHPGGTVVSEDTGFDRPYGENPNPGFDTNENPPPGIDFGSDDRLSPIDRVLGIRAGEDVTAFSFERLSDEAGDDGVTVVNETGGGHPIVVIWKAGTRSALDEAIISGSRDVGSAVAYSRELGNGSLRFEVRNGRIVDDGTGSTWDVFGTATAGPLEGRSLESVDLIEAFWFQWAAFHPQTTVWAPAHK